MKPEGTDPRAATTPRVLMVGPLPPAVGGVAEHLALMAGSSLSRRFKLIPFSTAKRGHRPVPNRPQRASFPYLVFHVAKLFIWILKYRPQLIYLEATSDTGFIRDTALMTVARLLGRPVLCHLHGRPMGRLFAREGGTALRFTRWGMARASAVVVLSPGLAREFAAMFPDRTLVPIPNVVDLDRFHPPSKRTGGAPLRVLTVGRLSRNKGTWDLLRIAAAAGPDFEFRLCGTGETEAEDAAIRAEAQRAGLGERVRFLGVVRGEDLAAEYRHADLFLLPTYAEIFPVVVLEALASGLPVVTTDVPAIPEMFDEGVQGHRLRPGDVEGLTAALRRLAADSALRTRMGRAARQLAEARYGVETGAAAVADLILAILRREPLDRFAFNGSPSSPRGGS
jgi:glycosyltransferase involved in cell wall biosynthesis